METFGVIIVAAGKGSRMGTKESKQYLKLGENLFWYIHWNGSSR
ncbi:2-C-methyl-D-erythritol 4-phosphate cytidylyltransferase [Paenibacillus larvae]|nr:2-C-methyl-D-erythritol 4-phosphate cytidylyltransferase [Paenibacillus larvae]MDT2235887.1 2-C-methyl-D-erythritol 4-phosphate cytidylyltransferase [Paenibacillus larvae]